ncbi:MAG: hypothetical protein ACHQ50_10905 [Fimbriimonadales bacterium]
MAFNQYKNIVIEAELGVEVETVADETMNKMAAKGWQVIGVCPYTRPGKLLVTFGRDEKQGG